MKWNQLAFGVASTLFVLVPAFSLVALQEKGNAEPSPIQTVAQTPSVAIASGTFVAGEAPTTGAARIVVEGGHRYLEIDAAFSTSSMGPDLHVLLDSTQQPPQSYTNLGSTVNLGKLRSYTGAQRYPIPDAISIENYDSVVIWCRTANATFGYAPLSPATNARVR